MTTASTPAPTVDAHPVSPAEATLDLSLLAQGPALVVLSGVEMSAVLGAGYDWDEIYCSMLSSAFVDISTRLGVYKICKMVRRLL